MTVWLLPALNDREPGVHTLSIQVGPDTRTRRVAVDPPGALTIALASDGLVHIRAPGASSGTLLVIGPEGPEMIQLAFADGGEWRAPRTLPAGTYSLIAQAGRVWAATTRSQP